MAGPRVGSVPERGGCTGKVAERLGGSLLGSDITGLPARHLGHYHAVPTLQVWHLFCNVYIIIALLWDTVDLWCRLRF